MIKWAGWLISFVGAAHTILALTLEKAARHAGAWFSGELWGEDLSAMSPANSAYWLSLSSFGIPLLLVGLLVLWLDRRAIVPPTFVAWTLAALTVCDAVILGPTPGLLILVAVVLMLVEARRTRIPDGARVRQPRR
ncbi:hypothetical protein H0H10_21655 [Streptomyces sp. TRM S81-3]|uniref:Uncharacterized protein n=1 Tax=Streptomyces griseicoloratus TaxID=2752516 RepID=A0A926L524_9ACTN|nr:DUF6463 family protein [Streptomyces griseicoloratus]MBD0421726.1 hypothetical protein [Streptomyces griseicoloratus]